MTNATLPPLVSLLEASPEHWPWYPLLAVRCAIGEEVLRGVLVDGGGFNVYRATLEETLSMGGSAADRGLTWSEALAERFRVVRYASADALFADGWVVDVPD